MRGLLILIVTTLVIGGSCAVLLSSCGEKTRYRYLPTAPDTCDTDDDDRGHGHGR